MSATHTGTLTKTPLGLGLTIDPNNIIATVKEGSQAEREGHFAVGDLVLTVNGEPPAPGQGVTAIIQSLPMGAQLEFAMQRAAMGVIVATPGPTEDNGLCRGSIADVADLTIDTTNLRGRELTDLISARVVGAAPSGLSLLFRSFGYKFGVPVDADLVFDIRCLPNPYWITELRPLTGLDAPVQAYLEADEQVQAMRRDLCDFLETWLPRFERDHRAYMTVALGCTGGQHRSVYMAETLGRLFAGRFAGVLVRHRELER